MGWIPGFISGLFSSPKPFLQENKAETNLKALANRTFIENPISCTTQAVYKKTPWSVRTPKQIESTILKASALAFFFDITYKFSSPTTFCVLRQSEQTLRDNFYNTAFHCLDETRQRLLTYQGLHLLVKSGVWIVGAAMLSYAAARLYYRDTSEARFEMLDKEYSAAAQHLIENPDVRVARMLQANLPLLKSSLESIVKLSPEMARQLTGKLEYAIGQVLNEGKPL